MQLILGRLDIVTTMDKNTIIYGLPEKTKYRNALNSVLIELKNQIISPRNTERHFSLEMIKQIFIKQYKVELVADHIRAKKHLKKVVMKKWGNLITELETIHSP